MVGERRIRAVKVMASHYIEFVAARRKIHVAGKDLRILSLS